MKVSGIGPAWRSVLLAMIGGMMAAAYLDSVGVVDLGYGFAEGSLGEGVLMAITGALGGCAVLLVFRMLRELVSRGRK